MGGIDYATWQALGLLLTLGGLAATVVTWRRRGAVSGLRMLAWSLVPLALALTGLLKVVWRVGDAVAWWAVGVVFSPAVWLGLALAAVSAALFVLTGVLRRRAQERVGTGPRAASLPPAKNGPARPDSRPRSSAGMEDLSEIEDILRKHGIS